MDVWKKSHELVLDIYKMTSAFPQEERFGLTSQMRRAAVSITSNIAEGFGRTSYKEKAQFYTIARGSLTELQNQCMVGKDVGFLKPDDFERIYAQSVAVHRMLNALVRNSRDRST